MISNQCLTIPPNHSLARELYDLMCAQSALIEQMTVQPPVGLAKAFDTINDAMKFLFAQYRAERGGDDSCTVGLTYGAAGYPVVDGRPADGSPFLHDTLVKPRAH